ncbi:sushi, von Willebrand factor type A, EGF and pentraxin domain-containing protein 1 [Lingula anatina]|uniref:Sushi, von Willebrand factor type A, EGF and pentraxin domain-containing protein 1 n=1 Tax=Lingula anatina TaxID=7574 RepID=A0A1S3IUV4_LINAN|nr:sushi, von Willebrand factor type A, EGF and pentraxin domain-containing protein 1 [Lingula anatina]|eukprot:XP_013401853.1 sushi, von Willebrand factor type A, EGF and pentraxin domain-containing protein 1 [Lingula anatina]
MWKMAKITVFCILGWMLKIQDSVHGNGCPKQWEPNGVHCYRIFQGVKTFTNAENFCQTTVSGGTLAELDDSQKNMFIGSMASGYGTANFWIGLKRQSGTWTWVRGSAATFTFWNAWHNKPDANGDCTKLVTGGFWENTGCSNMLPFICQVGASCPPLPNNQHSTFDVNATSVGAVVTCTCNQAGYFYLNSTDTARTYLCDNSGEWNDTFIDCATCAPLDTVEQSTSRNLNPTTVEYTCNSGYMFSDAAEIKVVECQTDGQWNDTLGNCTEKPCPAVPPVTNAFTDTNTTTQGTVVTLTCQPGFLYPDGTSSKTVTCQSDSTWTAMPASCAALSCPNTLPSIQLGRTLDNDLTVYSTVTYYCYFGYEFPDGSTTKQMTCQSDMSWSNAITDNCQKKTCPNTPPINNTIIVANDTGYGGEVEYQCVGNMRFPDDQTTHKLTSCTYGKTWSPDPSGFPPCEVITGPCSGLPVLPDRAFLDTNSTASGTIATVSTEAGFKFQDGTFFKTIICKDGGWNFTMIRTTVVDCTQEPSVKNATRFGSGILYGTQLTYFCDNGTVFVDGSTERITYCNRYGIWAPQITDCEGSAITVQKKIPKPVPVEAKTEVVVAVTTPPFVICGVLIGGVILLDLATIGRHLAKMAENLKHFTNRLRGLPPPKKPKKKRDGPPPTCDNCGDSHETEKCPRCKYCMEETHKSEKCPLAKTYCKKCTYYGHIVTECREVHKLLAKLSKEMHDELVG